MYKLFLCLRYLRKRRIAFFAVAAVCLCVAMVLIVISVMGGFLQMVKDRSRGLLGDLVMENGYLQGFPFYQEFTDQMKADPVLKDWIYQATPVVISYGVLRFADDMVTKPVQIVGIRLQETCRVNDFKRGLFYERHYPGTTTLAMQKEPRYGLDAKGKFALPPALEAARRQWEASATPEEIRNAWRSRLPLFGMDQKEYPRELNRRTISQALGQEFLDRGIRLPANAAVTVLKKATGWRIDLQDDSYVLRQKDGRLGVYHGQYNGPGFYAPIPRELQLSSPTPAWCGEEEPGIILGTDLCGKRLRTGEYERYYHRGYSVQLTMVPMTDTGKIPDATGPPSKLFRYADDCRTGVYDIDSMSVYVDFDVLQPILWMNEHPLELDGENGEVITGVVPARATQIQIKLKPAVDPIAARDLIREKWETFYPPRLAEVQVPALLSRVDIVTWEKKQERFISAVQKEKILITVLFGVISVVAVFLVGSTFYMIVQQKTQDVGIIKSVGATSIGVAGIFLSYGAAVGVVGGALGILIGTLFVHNINQIQEMLIWVNPEWEIWSPEVYTFDYIPNTVEPWDAVVIYVVGIAASMVGSVVASVRAARIWPVEALRYE